MLALARGMHINLYSTSAFLLSFHEPTASIALDGSATSICLLKRVRIRESGSGPGQPAAGGVGGKEYLVMGTQSGNLSLIESPSHKCSRRLPLFPSAVHSAHLLPATLGRRLRSTLLVSSVDGTVSIVDIERATAMVTFPNHDCWPLVAFATLPGQNMVALTHRDGVRREWNMGEEDGGVLVNPPPSRGSSTSAHSQEDAADNANGGGVVGGGGMEWITVRLNSEEDDKGDNEDGVLQPWDGFCRVGLPTAAVNVRAVLDSLDEAVKTAAQRTRPAERRVVANHPAIVNAKCLLTALVPEGDLGAYLDGDDKQSGDDDKVEEWKAAVSQFLFRRRRTQPAALGQIGAGQRVSMLTPGEALTADGENEISPTLTSIRFLAVLSLVSMLLQATGKAAMMDDGILDRMIRNHLGRRSRTVALGVFAKFWSDAKPVIRRVARACLDASMGALTEEERGTLVDYWSCYLPVLVPPELSSAKEVVRSVIVLGKLITDYDHGYDESLKKSVARSAELLLHESNPLYQDTAMEMIGYSWTPFQNCFDAYAAIHSLVRISATTSPALPARRELIHRSFLEIAAKNSLLLASSLANSISNESLTAAPSAVQPQGLAEASAEAMRIVTFIVRTHPAVFADVLSVLVEAVLKILDPSSNLNSSNSGLRETVLPTVTELVEALVRSYSTLAFHRPSQRLALSAAPGIIGVYDLKTSQASYMLDGHRRLASHLCFNVDGKCLAALDTAEKTLYVWRFGGGLLSYLGTEGDKPLQPRAKRVYDLDGEVVEVAWKAERKAVVRLEDGSEVEAVV